MKHGYRPRIQISSLERGGDTAYFLDHQVRFKRNDSGSFLLGSPNLAGKLQTTPARILSDLRFCVGLEQDNRGGIVTQFLMLTFQATSNYLPELESVPYSVSLSSQKTADFFAACDVVLPTVFHSADISTRMLG